MVGDGGGWWGMVGSGNLSDEGCCWMYWISPDVKPTEHSEGQGHTVAGLRGRSLRGTDLKHPKHAGWDRNIPVFLFINRPQVVWEGTSPCCQYLKYLGNLGLGTSAAQAALERMDMT